jgi:hypothetical protein
VADEQHEQTGEPTEAPQHIEGQVTLTDSSEVPAEEQGSKVPAPPGPDPEPTPRTVTTDDLPDEEKNEGVSGRNVAEDGIADTDREQPPIEGGWVDVVDGEHKGRRGAWRLTTEREDGEPKTILVRTRDELNELIEVAVKDVRHAAGYAGGR